MARTYKDYLEENPLTVEERAKVEAHKKRMWAEQSESHLRKAREQAEST